MSIEEYIKTVGETQSIVKDASVREADECIDETLDKMRNGYVKKATEYLDDLFKSLSSTCSSDNTIEMAVGDKLKDPTDLFLYDMFEKDFVLHTDKHIDTEQLYRLIKNATIIEIDIPVKLHGELIDDTLKLDVCVKEMTSDKYYDFEQWVGQVSYYLGVFLDCKKVKVSKKVTLLETLTRVLIDLEIKK